MLTGHKSLAKQKVTKLKVTTVGCLEQALKGNITEFYFSIFVHFLFYLFIYSFIFIYLFIYLFGLVGVQYSVIKEKENKRDMMALGRSPEYI